MTEQQQLERYQGLVEEMAHADLIDQLLLTTASNRYGSHDSQIKAVRTEMLKRMTHYR